MKKIGLLLPILLIGTLCFSQKENKPSKDSTRIKMGNSTIIIIKNNPNDSTDYDYDFGSCDSTHQEKEKEDDVTVYFDLGMNGYLNEDQNISLPSSERLLELDYAKSRSFSFGFMLKDADIIKDRFYISPGIGLSWNNYFFKNNINISTSNDITTFTEDSVVEYSKYKLRSSYLDVPIVLGLRIGNPEKAVNIQAGIIGGLKLRSIIKRKYTLDDARHKDKVRDDFNINPFKLEAIARLTYDDFGFFAKYSFTSLFENNKAPELNPFSIGVTVGNF